MAKAGSLPFSFTMDGYVTNHRGRHVLKYMFSSPGHAIVEVSFACAVCVCTVTEQIQTVGHTVCIDTLY